MESLSDFEMVNYTEDVAQAVEIEKEQQRALESEIDSLESKKDILVKRTDEIAKSKHFYFYNMDKVTEISEKIRNMDKELQSVYSELNKMNCVIEGNHYYREKIKVLNFRLSILNKNLVILKEQLAIERTFPHKEEVVNSLSTRSVGDYLTSAFHNPMVLSTIELASSILGLSSVYQKEHSELTELHKKTKKLQEKRDSLKNDIKKLKIFKVFLKSR
jgi:hypothetical protein